jgi:ABC-type branched-subunit amino acid transport system substrate-binding protein
LVEPTAAPGDQRAFINQNEVFAVAGAAPKTVVYMHVNDTFGAAMAKGVGSIMPKYNMPYTIVEEIAYDPTARELWVEIAKAKATGTEALMVVSRANDAILLTREMVKQRSEQPVIASACAKSSPSPTRPGPAKPSSSSRLCEWAYACAYQNSDQRTAELFNWLHRYNWHRPHGSLKANTPISCLGLPEDNLLRLHS